jgi:hypothetical protein
MGTSKKTNEFARAGSLVDRLFAFVVLLLVVGVIFLG